MAQIGQSPKKVKIMLWKFAVARSIIHLRTTSQACQLSTQAGINLVINYWSHILLTLLFYNYFTMVMQNIFVFEWLLSHTYGRFQERAYWTLTPTILNKSLKVNTMVLKAGHHRHTYHFTVLKYCFQKYSY